MGIEGSRCNFSLGLGLGLKLGLGLELWLELGLGLEVWLGLRLGLGLQNRENPSHGIMFGRARLEYDNICRIFERCLKIRYIVKRNTILNIARGITTYYIPDNILRCNLCNCKNTSILH